MLATIAPLTLVVAPSASAASTTPLPFPAFGSVAFDPVHGKVYVSGGKVDSRVAVLSTSGKLEKVLTNLPGASGLAFDPGSRTLYVSLSSAEIARIDTSTDAVSGRFSVSPYVPNGRMAYAGGRLWFGQSCADKFAPIVHVDPDGSDLGVSGPGNYCATFATTPGHPELLAVSELGLSPVDAFVYRVDNGDFTLQAQTHDRPFSNLQNLAFNSSGTTLYGASGSPYEIQSFRLPDLAANVKFPVGAYPAAVATGGDSYLAAGRSSENTITTYASGNPSPLRVIDLPAGRDIASAGLVFGGPTTLLAVTVPRTGTSGTVSVHVFGKVTTPPQQATVRLTSSARSVTPGGRVTLRATVNDGATGTVQFYNGFTLIGERAVSNGSASLSVRIEQTGTFSATYSGDDSFTSAKSGSLTVATKLTISLGFSAGSKRTFKVGSRPGFIVTVRPAAQVVITTVLQKRVGTRWIEGRQTFTTDPSGDVLLFVKPKTTMGHYRLRAMTSTGSSLAQTPWYAFELRR